MRTHRLIIAGLVLGLLAQCSGPTSHAARFFVFGTLVEVRLVDVPGDLADRAFAELQARFTAMHRDWHAWEPGELTALNAAFAAGRTARVSPDLRHLIEASQPLEQRTGGAFNPAIGGLVATWGFHTSDFPVTGPAPTDAEIDAWVARRPSMGDLVLDGDEVRSENPAVRLDFGGIAKGYAVDLALERLRALGVANAMVNAGGDLRAIGSAGGRPWRVAIRRPGGGVIGGIEVGDGEAVFTSGTDQRFRESDGARYPHLIDPRTGRPARGLAQATVIAPTGLLADAAATALVVAGPDGWRRMAQELGLDAVLVVDAEGGVEATGAMAARLLPAEGAGEATQ